LGGERILGLGQSADVEAPNGTGFAENLLRDG